VFIGELEKVLKNSLFKKYDVGEQIKILKDYFCVLKDLFSKAWVSKKHVLCKTLGVVIVLLIIIHILMFCTTKNSFTKNTMKSVLA
jgi:hypothetical protein